MVRLGSSGLGTAFRPLRAQLQTGGNPILFRYSAGDDWEAMGGTFTRASLATYIDEDGIVRFAPHNYVAKSEDFTASSGWAGYLGPSYVGTATAPDGTNTAGVIDFTGSGNGSAYYNNTASAGVYGIVVSAWVKSPSGPQTFGLGSGVWGIFTATTEWQRFEFSIPGSFSQIDFRTDGTTGIIHVWGAQLERGIKAGKYLKTTGSPRFDGLRDQHYAIEPQSEAMVQGTLLEGQRTNYCTYSDDFANAAWSPGVASVTANTHVAPDGSMRASTLHLAQGNSIFYNPSSLSGAGTNTVSIWVKSVSGTATFKLDVTDLGASNNFSAPFTANTSWKRFTYTFTTASAAQKAFLIGAVDGAVDLVIWGAQLEAGAFPSSYIPTVASAVTRAADTPPLFPIDFDPQEITIFVRAQVLGPDFAGYGMLYSLPPNLVGSYLFGATTGTNGWRARYYNGSSQQEVFFGQVIDFAGSAEFRHVLKSDGVQLIGLSQNGAAESLSTETLPLALSAGWGDNKLSLSNPTYASFISFRDIIIAKGVRDLAYFRAKLVEPDALFEYTPGDSLAGATFTRASSARYFNAAGVMQSAASGAIRDNHYVNGVRTYLSEPQVTNNQLGSMRVGGADWSIGPVATLNFATAPDGTLTASKLSSTGVGAQWCYSSSAAYIPATFYTLSFYVKYVDNPWIALRWEMDTTAGYAWFNVQTGVVGTVDAGAAIRGIQDVGNGWFRVWLAAAGGTTTIGPNAALILLSSGNSVTTPPAAGKSVLVWGAQVEVSHYRQPSSFIPTDSVAVTRNGDVLTFPFPFEPQNQTIYLKGWFGGYGNINERLFIIGQDSTGGILSYKSANHIAFGAWSPLGFTVAQATGLTPNDLGEIAFQFSNGIQYIEQSINGAASTINSAASAGINSYGLQSICIGHDNGLTQAVVAIQKIKVFKGKRDIAFCRAHS